jgi:hypothetical protein
MRINIRVFDNKSKYFCIVYPSNINAILYTIATSNVINKPAALLYLKKIKQYNIKDDQIINDLM